jgi:hypothetical protein
LGDLNGSGLEEAPAGSRHRAARADKDGAPPVLGELFAPPELGGFRDSGAISLVLGVEGLFTFWDSPPTRALCTEVHELQN